MHRLLAQLSRKQLGGVHRLARRSIVGKIVREGHENIRVDGQVLVRAENVLQGLETFHEPPGWFIGQDAREGLEQIAKRFGAFAEIVKLFGR